MTGSWIQGALEAHALRDSSMCSHMVSKNTVEDSPTLSPMMELKKNGICRLCFSPRGVNIAEPAPFAGRSRRMIKFGSRIDDDDDDESLCDDDDLPPLEEVEGTADETAKMQEVD